MHLDSQDGPGYIGAGWYIIAPPGGTLLLWRLQLIADPRIPLEKLITHKVPLEDVETVLFVIEKSGTLDGKEIVKVMMDPTLHKRSY